MLTIGVCMFAAILLYDKLTNFLEETRLKTSQFEQEFDDLYDEPRVLAEN